MATNTYAPSAGDGHVKSSGGSWATARAGSGTLSKSDTATTAVVEADSKGRDFSTYNIFRAFLGAFDTSDLDDAAVITSGRLRVYGNAKISAGSVVLVEATPASDGSLATSDFSQVGTTELSSRIAVSSLSTTGYNDFTLNAAGLAAINKTGVTRLALRMVADVDNSAPADFATQSFTFYAGEDTNGSRDPILEVTYAVPVSRTGGDTLNLSDAGSKTALRSGGDTLTLSDAGVKRINSARTAGTRYTVWAGGTPGTFGAHYGFPTVVRQADGKLRAFCRKGTKHDTLDGSIVTKTSSDDGATWSSEATVIDGSVTTYDERDPKCVKLASGRLVLTWGRRKANGSYNYAGTEPQFAYSDDNGATWSTPVSVTSGLYAAAYGSATKGVVYGSDIVELDNGDLLMFGYGTHSSSSYTFDLFCSKSTDGGATWANWSYPALASTFGYNCVEPQVVKLANGKLGMSWHTEDGVPTDTYFSVSGDNGLTWSHTLLFTSVNRQGLAVMEDGLTVIISYHDGSVHYYRESLDLGKTFGPAVTIGGAPNYGIGLWIMSVSLGGSGPSQNIGFIYNSEYTVALVPQAQADVFYQQFSGRDGIFVYLRTGGDTLTLSDTATRTSSRSRTGADTLTLTDTATRSGTTGGSSGGDTLTLSDAATRTSTRARPGADTLTLSDSARRTATTDPANFIPLPATANFVSARSQTADFVSPSSHTGDFVSTSSSQTADFTAGAA